MKSFSLSLSLLLFTIPLISQQGLPSAPNSTGGTALLFPKVIDDIFAGNFTRVPDDQLFRAYVVSVYKGIYQVCNVGGDGIGYDAGAYGFQHIRQLLETGHSGKGTAFTILQDMASGKSVGESAQSFSSIPSFYEPGVEDGIALAQTYKCNSVAVRGLKIKMQQLFTKRKSINPEANDLARWKNKMHPDWRSILGDNIPDVEISSATLANESELRKKVRLHKNKTPHSLRIGSRPQTTNIEVKAGDIIELSASGYIKLGFFAGSSNPGGIDGYQSYNRIPRFKHGALLLRIGNGGWQATGKNIIIEAAKTGTISFMVNDKDGANNSGAYNVEIFHYHF